MKKKILKISAFCIALILIGFVISFANSLVGNPISAALARNTAQNVIKTEYNGTDYKLERVTFNFKDGNYYAYIISESNMDGDFTLHINMLGRLMYDDHDYRVDGKSNVSRRLSEEYRISVEEILESAVFPYQSSCYGELRLGSYPIDDPLPENAVKREELENNKIYNVGEIGKTNGYITLLIEDDTVTFEKAAEILLKTKALLDTTGLNFYAVDLSLRNPKAEDSFKRPEGIVWVESFLYTDIYAEGLAERIEQSDAERAARYSEMDKEK